MASSPESSVKKPTIGSGTGSGVWRKVELTVLFTYAGCFLATVLFKSMSVSTEYDSVSKAGWLWGLKQGWIMNRKVDLSDSQWRNFRSNLPVLAVVMGSFTAVGQILRSTFQLRRRGMSWFWLTLSLVYIVYLHGASVLFILAIALGNYYVVKFFGGTSVLPAVLWGYNLLFLICNRVYGGYRFSSFGEPLAILDNYRGVMRWHISFNLVMLRLVSFGLDFHWAQLARISTTNWEKHTKSCKICQTGGSCYLSRQEVALKDEDYNVVTYLAYLLFAPLYVAGPTISYNAFASQLDLPQKSESNSRVFIYGLRWILCMALMEFLTHFCYFNSLAISGVWQKLSPLEVFIVGYGVLNFMWLKFLLIWRFFRFWALVGGVETPENMLRCVNNCYDLEGFWKSWHASYNRWLVRYMYIPLGGNKWRMLNVWIIFTFVAVWHDLEWKLLSWAWVTCLLWVPELSIKHLMKTKPMQPFKTTHWYTECCAIAGAMNISGLMVANLVGFVVGPSGIWVLASLLFTVQTIPVLVGVFITFYVGSKIMFYKRELERASHGKIVTD
ncbi:membrane-bound O-acyltransferase GUP1_2 [Marchantia polymorpha subsp. ruderalis]|uniref:Membrane-bound O-acyltransferase C24H6.01c n=2 Tax=Marchantia polymorpha TaxID=3197 RepID=A0AAF6AZY4_MARPO|nr:hypothetical protein MARPO_0050s0014 [Marchantia polymorpha]PTQ38539.1 hypothetical protein MARPO_0050s0014 [Marchantia polymorpha]BBN05317.1 hypothetical protein Mp_3g12090 [Marchantia polymorpha subsp. ruderalis]BBN05318.1 hypothetical protein Mp_3g12090 [Marchantia polymorpha subsp. ruderalis]|eukprot:PTQ38538.1 hypothetical protein MARPO_0050s0014 [Marchantia polymorpha]